MFSSLDAGIGAKSTMKRSQVDDDDASGWSSGSAKRGRLSLGEASGQQQQKKALAGRLRTLNSKFAAFASARLEAAPEAAILEAARDYVWYARELEAQFGAAGETDAMSFGLGDCGQLGHGTASEEQTVVTAPRKIAGLSRRRVRLVACGGLHNVACTASGECLTWGCNDDCSLGRGGDEALPGAVSVGESVVAVGAGDTQSFAVGASGKLYGWGCYRDKDGGQWFHAGDCRQKQSTPMVVEMPGLVVEVRCGSSFNAALLDDGRVATWGIGQVGELARPARPVDKPYDVRAIVEDHIQPAVLDIDKCKTIACGGNHLLIATDRTVQAAGLNNYGQLGVGSTGNRSTLAQVRGLGAVVALEAGVHHSLALAADGKVYAWGRADYGQLGIGGRDAGDSEHAPKLVSGFDSLKPNDAIATLAAGGNHNLALTRTGALYAWGYGDMGALGTGDAADYPVPTVVNVATNGSTHCRLLQVQAGGQHSVIIAQFH